MKVFFSTYGVQGFPESNEGQQACNKCLYLLSCMAGLGNAYKGWEDRHSI